MHLGSIGPLPPAGPPPAGAQFLSSVGQLPDMVEQAQLQRVQVQAEKAKAGSALLAQIAPIIEADPSKAADPEILKQATSIAKKAGIPLPLTRGPSGEQILDANFFSTKPDFNTVTPAERVKGLALPKEQRRAAYAGYRNVPADYFEGEQVLTPGQGAITSIMTHLDKQVEELSAGRLDPIRFAQNLRGQAKNLTAAGVDTSQYLSPELLNARISDYAQAQVDRLRSLVTYDAARAIHLKDDIALKRTIEQDRREQASASLGYKFAALGERVRHDKALEAKWATDQQLAQNRLSLSAERLTAYERNLDSMIQNRTVMSDVRLMGPAQKAYADTARQLGTVQREYDSAVRAIQGAANNNAQPDQRLLDLVDPKKPDSLKTKLDTLEAKLRSYSPVLNAAVNGTYSSTIGDGSRRVETVKPTAIPPKASGGGAGSALHGTSKSGKPIYSTDGGTTWNYGNGP